MAARCDERHSHEADNKPKIIRRNFSPHDVGSKANQTRRPN